MSGATFERVGENIRVETAGGTVLLDAHELVGAVMFIAREAVDLRAVLAGVEDPEMRWMAGSKPDLGCQDRRITLLEQEID